MKVILVVIKGNENIRPNQSVKIKKTKNENFIRLVYLIL